MLQMVDQGRVELTTPAYRVVDPGLQKLGPVPGKQLTMSALWGHNPQMSRITIADLMGHSSGIHEYPGSLEYNALAATASTRFRGQKSGDVAREASGQGLGALERRGPGQPGRLGRRCAWPA